MAQLKCLDQAVVITSNLTNGEIARARRYFPDALNLTHTDKDGEVIPDFVVTSTPKDVPPSEVSNFGVAFPEGKADDKAQVTILIPRVTKDKKTYVKDNFGKVIFNLKKVEEQYAQHRAEFDAQYEALDECISVE